MLTLGAIHVSQGNLEESLAFRIEANRVGQQDLFTLTESQRAIAIVKSINGHHKEALNDLERLLPQIRVVGSQYPSLYYDYLNSLAVELGEVGRIEEAKNISHIVLASHYTFAYPEWLETANEIALRGYKSRSSVSVAQIEKLHTEKLQNVLHLPGPSPVSVSSEPKQPARILDYLDWKKKMGKDNGEDQNIDDMSDKDIFMEIMHLTSQEAITRKELQQILDAVKKITSKKN